LEFGVWSETQFGVWSVELGVWSETQFGVGVIYQKRN